MNKKRIRLTEATLHRIVKESVGRILAEAGNSDREQWEKEKRIFFNGLRNGSAYVDDNMVAVEWGHDETDPRYICFRFGDNKLTDDHFYIQSSPPLSSRSIKNIYKTLQDVYCLDMSEYLYDEQY